MTNSSTFLRVAMAALLLLFFSAISYIGVMEHLYFITVLALVIGLVSFWVWAKKSALSYRFLYPGMICFLIFTILPIFFSILISFTNLGTGHFFSKEDATQTLLQNTYLPENAQFANYKLYSQGKNGPYQLITTKGMVSNDFQLEQKGPVSLKRKEGTPLGTKLSPSEVFALKDELSKLTFTLPSGEKLKYHRTDMLLEKTPLYSYDKNKDALYNERTHEWFKANSKTGFYIGEKSHEKLLPGYYTVVGLKNYTDVFTNPNFKKTFLKVATWTFVWALVGVVLSFSLGISLAIFLNDKNFKGKIFYRNLLILPYSIPFFISVLVFKGMLNKDFGIINEALKFLTISPIPWLEDGFWAKIACLMVNLWLGFPYMFLVTTGVLQSIPESVYEAAKIDGANRWQRFRHITIPMVLNAITPLLIGSFAFNLGNFVGIYLLTGGGPTMPGATTPAGETDILISYTYRLAFEGAGGQLFGMASSIALFIFVIITFLTVLNFKLFNVNPKKS